MAKRGLGAPRKPTPVKPHQPAGTPLTPSLPKAATKRSAEAKPERPETKPSVTALDSVREDFQLIFGQNLRAARLKSELKQSEVAERTGLTQQYLSLIEAGQQNITLKTMVLLADVVGRNIIDMLRPGLLEPPQKP